MTLSAIILMIISMAIIWGGFIGMAFYSSKINDVEVD